jgi:hypothetical protein
MRVINGCLVAAVVAALLPQVLPGTGTVSGIMIIASAVVAFCAYLFGRASDLSHKEQVRSVELQSAVIEGDLVALEEAARVDEVFLPARSEKLEPTVWVSSTLAGHARRLELANLNRAILDTQHRAILEAQRAALAEAERLAETMLVWFDEKNGNVQLAPRRKGARKVPRSSQVLGSRLVH